MKPSNKPGTLRYALVGALIVLIIGVTLSVVQHIQIRRDVNAVNERNNLFLARVFANLVWPGVRDFVAAAGNLPIDTLKTHATIRETDARAIGLAKDVPLLKVKIYNLDGLTVFSTETAQVGENKRDYPGFVAARNGKVASVLERRDRFAALNETVRNRDILSSYVPIVGADGKVEGVFEIYTDVTEAMQRAYNSSMLQLAIVGILFLVLCELGICVIRRRDRTISKIHEEQLRLTEAAVAAEEANRTKSALLANMSHELRTPLNAVIGFAETMRMQPFGPLGSDKYVAYLDDIRNSGLRLLGIVDNVLEMARIDNGTAKLHIAGANVATLVADAVNDMGGTGTEGGATIHVHPMPKLPSVLVDERRIRLVLVQMLTNARKYTPPHGSIEVSARRNRNGDIEIAVTDTGIGMTPDEAESALIPFGTMDAPYDRASDGPQLGLPLARMIMELHGGSLSVESVLGKGTAATAMLPSRCVITDDHPAIASSFQI